MSTSHVVPQHLPVAKRAQIAKCLRFWKYVFRTVSCGKFGTPTLPRKPQESPETSQDDHKVPTEASSRKVPILGPSFWWKMTSETAPKLSQNATKNKPNSGSEKEAPGPAKMPPDGPKTGPPGNLQSKKGPATCCLIKEDSSLHSIPLF